MSRYLVKFCDNSFMEKDIDVKKLDNTNWKAGGTYDMIVILVRI